MPSKSVSQAKLMAACCSDADYPSCPPKDVACEFMAADKKTGILRKSFKEYVDGHKSALTEANLKAAEVEAAIGKRRFSNLIKHPYYTRFVQGTYVQPTQYQVSGDDTKYMINASNDGMTMVMFVMYKINHRVDTAHLYKWSGGYTSSGTKMWKYISTADSTGARIED